MVLPDTAGDWRRPGVAPGVVNKPVETQAATLTGAEAVVEMLRAHEVEIVFGLCGDTSLPLYDALARLPHGI